MDLIQCQKSTEDAFYAPSPLSDENINSDEDFFHGHEGDHHGNDPDEDPQYDDYDFDSREGCFPFCQKCFLG